MHFDIRDLYPRALQRRSISVSREEESHDVSASQEVFAGACFGFVGSDAVGWASFNCIFEKMVRDQPDLLE